MQQIVQYSSRTLLVCSLVLVLVVAALSLIVWLWTMRRPAASLPTGDAQSPPLETPVPTYVAIGPPGIPGASASDANGHTWVRVLHERMPPGTRMLSLGQPGMTLADANKSAIATAIQAEPDIITLWCVYYDSIGGVPLTGYLKELRHALNKLTKETDALVLLLNLPDLTLLMKDQAEERKRLVRGGIDQWNRVIAQAAERYGRRVHVVNLFPASGEILGQAEAQAHEYLANVVWEEIGKLTQRAGA